MKLKKLIENVFEENEINEEEFLSDVANYNQFGKSIYRNDSIYEVAKKLSEIARQANIHTVRETEDSFDKITVSRNMKELKSYSDQFHKVAKEAHGLQQRMESLYEDMGRVLNRYYEINEAHVYGHDDEDSELEEGGPGSGRPTKKGSKRDIEKRMDKAVSDANAKLDAAEKAMKAKKKKKNEGGPGSGPHSDDEDNPFDREPSDDELKDIEKQFGSFKDNLLKYSFNSKL